MVRKAATHLDLILNTPMTYSSEKATRTQREAAAPARREERARRSGRSLEGDMGVGQPGDRSRTWAMRGPGLLILGYFGVLLVILAATVPTMFGTLNTLNRQRAVYDTANAAASQLLVGALNEETGMRGYVLSGDPSFLEPVGLGSGQYRKAIDQLRSVDLGGQATNEIASTDRAFAAWESLASAAIADARDHDLAGARAIADRVGAKDRFDDFRTRQGALAATVESQLRASRQSLHHQVELSLVILIVATVIGVVIGIGMWLWWRLWGRRAAQQERDLADRAVLMQSAIDASSDSLYAKDLAGRHILANRARAAALTGDPDADLVGHRVDEFIAPDAAADIERNERLVIDTGRERQFQEVLPHPERPHIFMITKSPLRSASGEVSGIVGVARDVTDEMALLADRERLYQLEHNLAESLQRSMLGTDHIDDARVEVCARYHPAMEEISVGGDWYDVLPTLDDRVALIVGDAVGHGLDSATAMGQLRSALAALINVGADPASTLETLDRFTAGLPRARSATCLVAFLDPARGQIEYSSAGHLPPVVARPGQAAEILPFTQDPPLAVVRSGPRQTLTVPFPVGSVVALCTDGLVERRGEPVLAGLERLAAMVDASRDQSMDELCETVIRQVFEEASRQDDIALVSARLIDAVRAEEPPPAGERPD